jgi:pimeloyl-ACP methyl ester carboxylesterase
MYSGCSHEDADWAFDRLRPQASTMYTQPTPLQEWPDVAITDVRGDADQIVSPGWAARAIPQRLGVESQVIAGAGHSSMVSHPRELAALLLAD